MYQLRNCLASIDLGNVVESGSTNNMQLLIDEVPATEDSTTN